MKAGRVSRWLGAAVAAALAVAACTPADNALTPGGAPTDPIGITPNVTQHLPTEGRETEPVATEVEPTEPLATSGPTEGAMTPEMTAEATVEATAAATTEPSEEGQPSLLLSTELIGSQIVDAQGNNVGDVMEILVDDAGLVQYVVFDAGIYMLADDAATPDPAATADPNALNAGIVAAPLSEFAVNTTMNTDAEFNEEQVLVYQGTAADLETMAGFDLAVFDQDGFLIDTTDTTLGESFNGLIRVSEFSDWNLVNGADEDLGEVEDLVVDLNQEMVLFGIVDFGGFLGIGEQSTAVPWQLFTIQQTAEDEDQFMLDITQETLESAPVVDLGAWPAWNERLDTNADWNLNWQTDSELFWEAAASS